MPRLASMTVEHAITREQNISERAISSSARRSKLSRVRAHDQCND